jgi:antitoxin StbD
VIFGAQRRPEGVMISYELFSELVPVIEDLEIARMVRERANAGASVDLSDVAASIGLDPDEYR